jgi:hypothetical protein
MRSQVWGPSHPTHPSSSLIRIPRRASDSLHLTMPWQCDKREGTACRRHSGIGYRRSDMAVLIAAKIGRILPEEVEIEVGALVDARCSAIAPGGPSHPGHRGRAKSQALVCDLLTEVKARDDADKFRQQRIEPR